MQKIAELREAFRESKKYLLSHHEEGERHRCYSIKGRDLCARCTGIYSGIALGILLNFSSPVSAVASLPAAVTVEKIGELKGAKFSNPFRSFTGLLLGTAYGIGIIELLKGSRTAVLGIGAFYGAVGILLLKRTEADLKL